MAFCARRRGDSVAHEQVCELRRLSRRRVPEQLGLHGRVVILTPQPRRKPVVERVVIEVLLQLRAIAFRVVLLVYGALHPDPADAHEPTEPCRIAAAAPEPSAEEMIPTAHAQHRQRIGAVAQRRDDFFAQLRRHPLIRVEHQHPRILDRAISRNP